MLQRDTIRTRGFKERNVNPLWSRLLWAQKYNEISLWQISMKQVNIYSMKQSVRGITQVLK